jgi:hypothetical protein
MDAMFHIFDNSNIFEIHKWYIDLRENVEEAKTPLIPFMSYEDALAGGGTRKNKKQHFNIPPVYVRNPMKIQLMEFRKFLGK